ncbi:MAG: DUF4956 domain-containing protein [Acidimicrobiia bacterium]|nr:DUF4956 domain-containing protein [Acidimicrobiia bacterium]
MGSILGQSGDLFDFKDLSGNFAVADIFLTLVSSFVLGMLIAYTYRATHKGVSYSQSFVQTLVILAMVVSVVMLVIGSNLARAFSLVGALSIVRFRNAVKETRDVGFVFFTMIIGIAAGTRFYVLAAVAATSICLVILIMVKFNLFALNNISQILKVQVANDAHVDDMFDDLFLKYTKESDLISIDSVRSGTLTELIYSVVVKKDAQRQEFINAIRERAGDERVSLITGYDTTDL